jgi:hypothetical protein
MTMIRRPCLVIVLALAASSSRVVRGKRRLISRWPAHSSLSIRVPAGPTGSSTKISAAQISSPIERWTNSSSTLFKTGGEAVSEDSVSGGASKSTTLYVTEGGFINRVSVDGPTWMRFEEKRFLPQLLNPDLTWSNSLFPFGHLYGAFHVVQYHRTFLETDDVVVPAGRFSSCIRIETEAVYQRNLSQSDRIAAPEIYRLVRAECRLSENRGL